MKKEPVLQTHTGHRLSAREAKFIDNYVATGNGRQSILDAGYTCNINSAAQYSNKLLNKDYIASEIQFRINQHKAQSIAEADEILQYFTSVMRGETKDQFGLEAPLSERTRAAQELAKRKIDIPNKLAGREEPTLNIRLIRD